MPTIQDFRNLHQIIGLTTVLDLKNFFDCIPLHPADRKYAVTLSPLGKRRMFHITYGWMNAAPEAQDRTNDLALFMDLCLAYIDDIVIKHLMEEGTDGIIRTLYRLTWYLRDKNMLVNPIKFFPACDKSETFGFDYSMIGEMVSHSLQTKLLAIAKPKTKQEAISAVSAFNYINHHIYNNKKQEYWIRQLEEEWDLKGKRRLKWTKKANLCWEINIFLIKNLPMLYHPRKEGDFAITVDSCNYATGCVLWQKQKDYKAQKSLFLS